MASTRGKGSGALPGVFIPGIPRDEDLFKDAIGPSICSELDDRQYDFPLGRPDNAFYQILVLIILVLILTQYYLYAGSKNWVYRQAMARF